jgi:DNA (cytosine-5)-methyltransferase 1
MRVVGLFEGIGGFALAARWMGWTPVQFVEIDGYCQEILRKNFSGVPIHDDIRTYNGTSLRGTVNLITGGFPCQPFSYSGLQQGAKDYRYLWPEMFRVVREVRPNYVVAENVHGLLNWSKGLVFERVQADLESEGYQVLAVVLPACGVDAPHQRDRVWFVANLDHKLSALSVQQRGQETTGNINISRLSSAWFDSNSERQRRQEQWETRAFKSNPTLPNLGRGNKSRMGGGVYGVPNRVDRIKGLGNAIVPQVAYEIFKAIEKVNNTSNVEL